MGFRFSSSSLSLCLALTLVAAGAHSAPISFAIDPSTTLQIDFFGGALGSSSGSGGVQGTIDVDSTGGSLTVTGSDIAFDDIPTSTGSGLFGTLEYLGLHASLASPVPASDGGGGVYDLAGWTLTLDGGTLFLSDLQVVALDFSQSPLQLTLATALSTLDTSGPLATWQIPLTAVVTFWTGANTYNLHITGTLSLTEIPEPSTLLLLAAGLAWLAKGSRPVGVSRTE